MPPRPGPTATRALLSLASARRAASAAITTRAADAPPRSEAAAAAARSLYRRALRAAASLSDQGARDYYRAYARQNFGEYRDERDPGRVSQLLEHGRSALDFLVKKHLGGAKGGAAAGAGSGGSGVGAAGSSRAR